MADVMQSASVDTLNLARVSLKQFTKLVSLAFQSRMNKYDKYGNVNEMYGNSHAMERPMLAIGKPGIGKTEIMRTLLMTEFGLPKDSVVEIRLGSMQDTDIMGMPTIQKKVDEKGIEKLTTKFASLDVLPKADPERPYGILVLDELTTCNAAVRSVALQLLDSSRSVGEYTLPNGWMIVALGNGPDDGADYDELKSTIISRCAGYYVEVDWDLWYNWALSTNIHSSVLGFLNQSHGMDLFDNSGRGDYDSQIVTPRTWEITSDMIYLAEALSEDNMIPDDLIEPVCSSGIGSSMGLRFATFYRYKRSLIPLDEIMNGTAIKKYKLDELETSALYLGQDILAREIVRVLTEKDEYCQFFKAFARKRGMIFMTNKAAIDDSVIPDDVIEKVSNAFKYIIWTSNKDLACAIGTIQAITKVATNMGLSALVSYVSNAQFRIGKKTPELQDFVKQNAEMMRIIESSRKGANN